MEAGGRNDEYLEVLEAEVEKDGYLGILVEGKYPGRNPELV